MRTFGLIGYPLSHSFSPAYFAAKFERENIRDAVYRSFPLSSLTELKPLLENDSSILGLNITIPYKEEILQYIDEADPVVQKIKAANVLAVDRRNGIRLTAYNTDVTGFRRSVETLLRTHHHQALILGTGGAAKAIQYVLEEIGIAYTNVSRERKEDVLAYEDIDAEVINEHTLIINTTPLGMYPDIYSLPPIPYEYISFTHLLYDLVYNPHETTFLQKGKAEGATIKNGLEMLEIQAEESWKIWNRLWNYEF